jgi:hypothetical protein
MARTEQTARKSTGGKEPYDLLSNMPKEASSELRSKKSKIDYYFPAEVFKILCSYLIDPLFKRLNLIFEKCDPDDIYANLKVVKKSMIHEYENMLFTPLLTQRQNDIMKHIVKSALENKEFSYDDLLRFVNKMDGGYKKLEWGIIEGQAIRFFLPPVKQHFCFNKYCDNFDRSNYKEFNIDVFYCTVVKVKKEYVELNVYDFTVLNKVQTFPLPGMNDGPCFHQGYYEIQRNDTLIVSAWVRKADYFFTGLRLKGNMFKNFVSYQEYH